jgi:hypothetical protein
MNITPSFRNRPQTGAPASQGRATRARAAGRFDGLSPAPVTLARSRDQTLTFRSIPRHDPHSDTKFRALHAIQFLYTNFPKTRALFASRCLEPLCRVGATWVLSEPWLDTDVVPP